MLPSLAAQIGDCTSRYRLDLVYRSGPCLARGVPKVRIWPDFVTRIGEKRLDMIEDELRAEQAKRVVLITPAQREAWNDGLLEALVDTPSYRLKCTKEWRFAEQADLLRLMEDDKGRRNESQDSYRGAQEAALGPLTMNSFTKASDSYA